MIHFSSHPHKQVELAVKRRKQGQQMKNVSNNLAHKTVNESYTKYWQFDVLTKIFKIFVKLLGHILIIMS